MRYLIILLLIICCNCGTVLATAKSHCDYCDKAIDKNMCYVYSFMLGYKGRVTCNCEFCDENCLNKWIFDIKERFIKDVEEKCD